MEGVGTSRGFLIVSFFSEKPEVRSLTESEDGKQKSRRGWRRKIIKKKGR